MSSSALFGTVLIANRGEIACRVIRTLRDLGIRSVAVYSDADADARHVRMADVAVRIGPAPAAQSYLDIPAVIEAALATRADAIHPGYGFLSENPSFAAACADAGIVFVGPPVAAIRSMGDKIAAKTRVAAAGVPVVPGRHDEGMSDEQVAAGVAEIGFPALLKPSAGGGGKGMRVVREGDDVAAAIASARREAQKSFGDDQLLVERYIERPRHIEVQVLADQHGAVIHLGERECSLQRRHQKVIEEAPSPFVTAEVRERLGRAAVDAARSCGYVGAGTVEFIVDGKDADLFAFLEMNTRLQVEHPVTEMVTAWDLVAWQLRIAAGEPLPAGIESVAPGGHSIEARIYAEDPAREFLPSTGRLLAVQESAAARVDSGVVAGQEITPFYDPMISKVIVFGEDRAQALARLGGALADTAYLGVTTNVGFLQRLLSLPEVLVGDLHTGLIDDHGELTRAPDADDHVLAAAAMEWLAARTPAVGADPWLLPDGWRASGSAESWLGVSTPDGVEHDLSILGSLADAEVRIDDRTAAHAVGEPLPGGRLRVTFAGQTREYLTARDGDEVWLASEGMALRLRELDRLLAESRAEASASVGAVRSPMPGSVISVAVVPGDRVAEGQALVTVEAMKMEHTLTAPAAAVVTEVRVAAGDQVAMDAELVVLSEDEEEGS